MPRRVLIVAATAAEASVLESLTGDSHSEGISYGGYFFDLLVTGVGSVATAWTLTKWFCSNPVPDLAINIGIAGSYKNELGPGEVVIPVSDCFADTGIETDSGVHSLFEAGLEDPTRFPFRDGRIVAENRYVKTAFDIVKPAVAITVNMATGSESTISKLVTRFNPDIETMEGASFFYICSMEKIPFLALRSISNRVEPRNRKKWDIPLAIENLSIKFKEYISLLDQTYETYSGIFPVSE